MRSGGVLNNGGFFLNTTTVNNLSGGVINNIAGGSLENTLATLNNAGTLNNTGGALDNWGGTINNTAVLNNTNGGVLSNLFVLEGYGTTLQNLTSVDFGGQINNSGVLNNSAHIINGGGNGLPTAAQLAEVVLNNTGTVNNTGTLTNLGTLANRSGGLLDNRSGGILENDAAITNAGAVSIEQGSVLQGAGTFTQTAGSTLNAGVIKQGALQILGGSLTQNGGTTTISGNVLNAGTVSVVTNTFTAQGGFTNSGGVTIDSGATLDAATYTQTAGSTLLDSGTLDPTAVEISGGTFGGTGTVVGAITNDATFEIGGAGGIGTLTDIGSFTQNADGTFVDFLGSTGGSQLDVTGDLILGGALDINLVGRGALTNGNMFELVSYTGSISGEFTGINGYNASDWTLVYNNPGQVDLEYNAGTTQGVPDSGSTLMLLGVGMLVLTFAGLRVRRKSSV